MAEIVNLRMARKARDRQAAAKAAEASRAQHGRSKQEKALSRAEAERAARMLDGARREGSDD